jgi:hypothetical protein
MKKPYQIEAQRAVKQFEAMAAHGDPALPDGATHGRDDGPAEKRRERVGSPSRLAGTGSAD